jgi:hypothetical protein
LRNPSPEYSTAIDYPQILNLLSEELDYTAEMELKINIVKLN